MTLGEGWRFTDYGSALPNVDGKLWYKADESGAPTGEGYTPTELRNNWDAATMAGTWVLSDEVPEPPAVNTAFAVYCETDKTLTLYKDATANVPSAGGTYNGKAATQVFVIDETVTRYGDSPFAAVADVVENVEIAVPGDAGKIAPLSTDHWFEDFENLQEVDGWENADTSKVANTSYMYYNTDLSHGLSAPEFDTSSVTNMSYMFAFCSGLATPDFSSWDTSKVTNMENMFASCSSLSAPNLSVWNVSSVTNMSEMFYGCRSLTTLDLSAWTPTKVTTMSEMFYQCTALTSLNLSGWDTPELTSLYYAFFQDAALTSLDFEGWSAPKISSLQSTFNQCSALTELDLSSWGASKVTDTSSTFLGCTSLATLDLSGIGANGKYGNTFDQCAALSKVTFGEGWSFEDDDSLLPETAGKLWFKADADGNPAGDGYTPDELAAAWDGATMAGTWVLGNAPAAELEAFAVYSSTDNTLTLYKASNKPTEGGVYNNKAATRVFDIDEQATHFSASPFADVEDQVTKVIIAAPENADNKLTPKSTNRWFYNFSSLEQVDGWVNADTSQVTDMSYMFYRCNLSKGLDAPNLNTSAVTNMSNMFYGCKGLSSATGPDLSRWDVSNVTDMSSMFQECTALQAPKTTGWDTSSVTNMSSMFRGCSSIATFDLTPWDLSSVEFANYMFSGCSALTTITLPDEDMAALTNAKYMFNGCAALTTVNASSWVAPALTSASNMFYGCRALTSLDLSSLGATALKDTDAMFCGCSALATLDLSGIGIAENPIMSAMFTGCSALSKVTLGADWSFADDRGALPSVEGKLWYKADSEGNPAGTGYTGDDLAANWDGATMAGTWQLTTELEEPEPDPVELTGLSASDSLTYGETLAVTFTPKSGDDVVASGTATLKLGDKVLATSSAPQADGSFSLSYNTADKGVALGEQTLTVTFESTGYEAATGTVATTLSAKALTVEVTSSLDKTWDASVEVDGLAVELLGALEGDDVTVSATGAYASSDAGEQDVTLTLALSGDDAAWYTVSAPTGLAGTISAADIVGKLSLSGTSAFGETLTATYEPTSGEQVSYTWTRDGQVIDGATGSTYALTKEDVGAQIAVVATASDANHAGSVTSDAVTVAKAEQDAPAAPVATATSHTTIEVEALVDSPAGAKAEYSIDAGKTWQTETTFSGLEPETEYTVIARYQELDTHEASVASEGTEVVTLAATEPDPGTDPGEEAEPKAMHRLYNQWTGEHFYTADENERESLVGVGWTYEGIGWHAPAEGDDVYRLYNSWVTGGDHHYTLDADERDALVSVGWTDEGTGWSDHRHPQLHRRRGRERRPRRGGLEGRGHRLVRRLRRGVVPESGPAGSIACQGGPGSQARASS